MRVMGVDLGERRIGVAVSDSAGMLASPRVTLVRDSRGGEHRRQLADLVVEEAIGHVVVGLPLRLGGDEGPATRSVRAEMELLGPLLRAAGASVELWDERLTTVSATRHLRQAGVPGRRQRASIDQAAAVVLLQAWLEARAHSGSSPAAGSARIGDPRG